MKTAVKETLSEVRQAKRQTFWMTWISFFFLFVIASMATFFLVRGFSEHKIGIALSGIFQSGCSYYMLKFTQSFWSMYQNSRNYEAQLLSLQEDE